MRALLRPDAKLERVTGREPPSPQTFPQEGFNCRSAPTFQSTCSSSFQSLTPDVYASEKSCRWEDLIKKKKEAFVAFPQRKPDKTGQVKLDSCFACGGGGSGEGATAQGSAQCCRITVRSEPSAGQRMWPTSGGQLRRSAGGGSGGTKEGEGWGAGAEQADQLSLLFVSLHHSESRTGAFSSPSLADPAGKGPFLSFRSRA